MATKKKPKKRLVLMDTEEVSIVDAGANGHSKWLMVKSEDGKTTQKGLPKVEADDEMKKSAQTDRSKKYGIEVVSTDLVMSYEKNNPTSEKLFGDPVNLLYPMGKADNKRNAGLIEKALCDFRDGNNEDHDNYKTDISKVRVLERIVRSAISKGIQVSFDPEDETDKLLPADLKKRLSDEDDKSGNSDGGQIEPPPQSTSSKPTSKKSGQGADLVTDYKATSEESRKALSLAKSVTQNKALRDRAMAAIKTAKNTVGAGASSQDDEVGIDKNKVAKQEIAELKKTADAQAATIKRLEKTLTSVKANKARVSTTIGTSQTLRPREVIKTAEEAPGEDDGLTGLDLSPPLKRPEGV